jgi:UDP-2,3-diacylglucosamine hydrolase
LLTPQLPTLFVSDLHLSARRPETTDLFLHFLAGPAQDAGALYILGDLFDYWAGDDDLIDPFNRRIVQALADLEIPKFFLPGNRDFLADERFGVASRLTFIDESSVIDIAGTPTLLLHGDTLCTDDLDYQAARKVLRSDEWQRKLLALPLSERKRKIEGLREQSETAKGGKSYDIMDANAEAVAAAFHKHGVVRMIHGHTHRQARHEHIIDGRSCERWVLGDWHTTGNALACDASGCHWLAIR